MGACVLVRLQKLDKEDEGHLRRDHKLEKKGSRESIVEGLVCLQFRVNCGEDWSLICKGRGLRKRSPG